MLTENQLRRIVREEVVLSLPLYEIIRKLPNGKYRLYSKKKNPKTGQSRNLGTFDTRSGAEKHEQDVQFFKHKG